MAVNVSGDGVEQAPDLTPRRAATRQRLVDAAETVFARRGVMAASVEEICEEAGFTRGAFYSNFASKDELCAALLDSRSQRDFDAAQLAIRNAGIFQGSIDAVINEAMRIFFQALPRTRESILAYHELRLYAAREPQLRDAFDGATAQLARVLARALEVTVHERGLTLLVPGDQLLELMHALWYDATMEHLVRRPASDDAESPDLAPITDQMAALMRILIVKLPA